MAVRVRAVVVCSTTISSFAGSVVPAAELDLTGSFIRKGTLED
jgi:hypothetical protein